MIPYNLTEYPEVVYGEDDETYHRLYVRHRFIVYEIYNRANLVVGFLVITSKQSLVIQGLPYQSMFNQLMAFADRNENNEELKIIAKKP